MNRAFEIAQYGEPATSPRKIDTRTIVRMADSGEAGTAVRVWCLGAGYGSAAVQERSNMIPIAIGRYDWAAHKLLRSLLRHAVPVAIYWIYDQASSAGGGEHLGNIRLPQCIEREIREWDLVVVRAVAVLVVFLELKRSLERPWAIEKLAKSEEAIAQRIPGDIRCHRDRVRGRQSSIVASCIKSHALAGEPADYVSHVFTLPKDKIFVE